MFECAAGSLWLDSMWTPNTLPQQICHPKSGCAGLPDLFRPNPIDSAISRLPLSMRLLQRPALAFSVFVSPVLAQDDPLVRVEETSGAWIELRAETVRAESTWLTEQALLESTIAALEERATAAEEERDLVREKTAKDREEIDGLAARLSAAQDDAAAFETHLQEVNARLLRLRPALPPRLSDALEVAFSSLAGTELSSGERMQLTISTLNRCAEFNRTITCGDEVLQPDGTGEPRLYEVIYWGLSHGYALDRASRRAWYGSPAPGGWRWELRDDLVEPATKLIAIHRDQADPSFIPAPARLARPVASSAQP